MASVSAFHSFCETNHRTHRKQDTLCKFHASPSVQFRRNAFLAASLSFRHHLKMTQESSPKKIWSIAATEEEPQISEQDDVNAVDMATNEAAADEQTPTDVTDQSVSVPVSPSDKLLMLFQAEGTISDIAIPEVTKALEGIEGISDLKVQVSEGIASVELTKQTTIQATGVASGLIEIIQGSGFKLQTLNLSFDDEELVVA